MAIHGTKIMWRTLRNEKKRLQRKKHQLQIKQRRLQIKEGLLQAVGTTGQTANTAANVARQTSAFLQEAAHMEGSAEVAEVLLSLAQVLTEDTSPKAAASVLEEIGKVAEKMDKKLKAFQAVQQVEIMIRDIVVLRCLACIDPMDREAFINASKCAFDKKEPEMANAAANAAAETTQQTSAFLQKAAHMKGGAEVAEVLLSFGQTLTGDTSPKAAASVHEEIGKVAKKMDKKSKVSQAVQQAKIMIRDIVVLRCLACIDPMNRDAFIEALKDAFDKKELERDFRALLLLAHKKACSLHGINTFKSASEKRNTTRPPRKRKGNANAHPAAEDHGIFHLACGHSTNDLRQDCAQCKQHYEKMESGHGDATEPAASEFPLPAFVPLPEVPAFVPLPKAPLDFNWRQELLVKLGGTDGHCDASGDLALGNFSDASPQEQEVARACHQYRHWTAWRWQAWEGPCE